MKQCAKTTAQKTTQASEQYVARRGTPSLDSLSKAGQVLDRNGLTKAGRALQKHGDRPGSIFPKVTGSSTNKNAQGQFHLDDILTHPKSTIIRDFEKGGFKIYSPNGRGVYFRNDGTLRGFIERQYE